MILEHRCAGWAPTLAALVALGHRHAPVEAETSALERSSRLVSID
jgi:hypothetical protein